MIAHAKYQARIKDHGRNDRTLEQQEDICNPTVNTPTSISRATKNQNEFEIG